MIRFLTIMFLCAAFLCPLSCSKHEEKVKIGFIVPRDDEWYQLEWHFADEAAKQYNFELQKRLAVNGEKVQTALDTFGAQGVQGVVICAPDVKLGPSIAATCKRLNMKLLSTDDQLINAQGKFLDDVPHVGINARNIGMLVGQSLADEMKKRGWKPEETSAMAITYDQVDTCRQRTTGAAAVLETNGIARDHIYMVPRSTPPDQNAAFNAANDALTSHQNVKNWLVFSSNDDGVLGAIRALEGHGVKPENTIGIGIDGTVTAINEFKKKDMTGFVATVVLQPRLHGFSTAEAMYQWVTQNKVPPKVTTTTGVLVDRSNYAAKMQELGLKVP